MCTNIFFLLEWSVECRGFLLFLALQKLEIGGDWFMYPLPDLKTIVLKAVSRQFAGITEWEKNVTCQYSWLSVIAANVQTLENS